MADSAPYVNLKEACGETASWQMPALNIEVTGALDWQSGETTWALSITKPTRTPSGRSGKPEKVVNIVGGHDDDVPKLLRDLADIWETELPDGR